MKVMRNFLFVTGLVILFILAMMTSSIQGKPIFDLLFGGFSGGYETSRGYRSGNRGREGRSRGGGGGGGGAEEYKRICRVLNPDPYAFIGSNPYPAAPFCPP